MKRTNRREFLRITGATGAALSLHGGSVFGQLVGAEAPFADYRALVCIFLFGGNDSFNMLVPRSQAEYSAYAKARQNLALPRDDLLPIAPLNAGPGEYGLHPSMPELASLFESGSAAFVVNVGPLIEPTTKEAYRNMAVELPPMLFSHQDQQAQWQKLNDANAITTGWAGRIADLLRENVGNQRLTINVSLNGNNLFQASNAIPAYSMGETGPARFTGLGDSPFGKKRRRAFERVVEADYDSIYLRSYASVQRRALETADLVSDALEAAPQLSVPFPDTGLGQQLRTITQLIATRDRLETTRQIFFAALGGFDTHDDQLTRHPPLLAEISSAIAAFHQATVELGVADSVTLFTQSDFGRTLTSNGNGTDHGWGSVQIVAGGAVAGRQLYGTYPLQELGGPEDLGRGRMIPSISADQYAATLARWFGIPDADLEIVAPHLSNFSERDLRFLF